MFAAFIMGISLGGFQWDRVAAHDAIALGLICGLITLSATLRLGIFEGNQKVDPPVTGLIALTGWTLLMFAEPLLSSWANWHLLYSWSATIVGLVVLYGGNAPRRIIRLWGLTIFLSTQTPISVALGCLAIGLSHRFSRSDLHAVLIGIYLLLFVDVDMDFTVFGLAVLSWLLLFRNEETVDTMRSKPLFFDSLNTENHC